MGVIHLGRFSNGFTIGNLRLTDIGADLEFAQHTINNNLQMKLAHSTDDGLAALLISRNTQRRIFLCKPCQRHTELVLISLGLSFDRDINYRLRKLHTLQNHRVRRITQRFTCGRILEAGNSDDFTSTRLGNVFTRIGMHQQHPANPLFAILNTIQNLLAGFDHSGIHPHECQRTNKRIGHHLEREGRHRLVIRTLANNGAVFLTRDDAVNSRHLGR